MTPKLRRSYVEPGRVDRCTPADGVTARSTTTHFGKGPGIMVTIRFTQNLQRHVPCPPCAVAGHTVREVLDAAFALNPAARGYVLDDQGALRRHMLVFVNGTLIHDRRELTDSVAPDATVDIMQALSGG